MSATLLERGKKAFYRKKYNDVITLLEPNVIQYRDSFQFYYVLGLACLYSGDAGGASSYFQRARQIKMRDPDLLTAQAALFLRRGDTHQAVEYCLEALEYAPSHALARRMLDFIRKKGDDDTISAFVENGKIARFYPRLAKKRYPLIALSLASVLVLVISFTIVIPRLGAFRQAATTPRADLSSFALDTDERSSAVDQDGSFRYVLTQKDILNGYSAAQRYFQQYRDNAAQVEINRLLLSNATISIKQKARLLMTYFAEPGFDSIQDNYPYTQVREDPDLYLDCWVVWKGMAANVVTTDNNVRFDFLVGYDTRNTLEGIIPVAFETVLPVDIDKPLQLLAKITSENGKLSLTGKAIYQSGKPE